MSRHLLDNFFPVLAVEGTLKGYDQLLNLVLDETLEFLRGKWVPHYSSDVAWRRAAVVSGGISIQFPFVLADKDDPLRITDKTRTLGLVVRPVTLSWDTVRRLPVHAFRRTCLSQSHGGYCLQSGAFRCMRSGIPSGRRTVCIY
jgi:hypothetical protein